MTDPRAAIRARCAELRKIALDASDGPWRAAENLDIGGWAVYPPGVELGTGPEVADFTREADARLIAAFGPASRAGPDRRGGGDV